MVGDKLPAHVGNPDANFIRGGSIAKAGVDAQEREQTDQQRIFSIALFVRHGCFLRAFAPRFDALMFFRRWGLAEDQVDFGEKVQSGLNLGSQTSLEACSNTTDTFMPSVT